VDESNDPDTTNGRVLGLVGAVLENTALEDMLQRVVLLACHTVTHADAVSITVPDGDGFRTTNAVGEEAEAIDQAQYDGNGGPCLEAFRSARQVQALVNGHDGRDGRGSDGNGGSGGSGGNGRDWSRFEERARDFGVAAVLSTPLVQSSGEALGALNMYSRDGGFSEDDTHTAEIIANHATLLLASVVALVGANHLNEQLRQALASREVIGEAKGIIMERQNCTRDEAFDILRRASQRENRKLRDLAEELVARVEARKGPKHTP
jgi:hypothetical protein